MQFTHAIRRASKRRRNIAVRRGRIVLAAAGSLLAAGAVTGPAAATAASAPPNASANFSFRTLNDHRDPTFNQLLGINSSGVIAGYFGSGAAGHPNKGYVLSPPYGQQNYRNENFPGSAQTQVTGLDNVGITVGFWANKKGANFGFYQYRSRFHNVNFPTTDNAKPQVDQLLGVNDHGIAVGFYNDRNGNSHGYTYNTSRNSFHRVTISGATSVTAAAINNSGDIAGFYTSKGTTQAFLLQADGHLIKLAFPGASMTQAFGVGDGDEVVGAYTMGSGSSATTDGFIWAPGFGFQTVDDPNGIGATTVNGVNDRGQLVGFYTDKAGNTDGMLATP
jgi:hypothetical protein